MRRRALAAFLAAGLLLPALARPVQAVGSIPGRPIPDEPPVIRLADLATAALVVDLDRDGSREVVAVAADEPGGVAAVQAWWMDEEGSLTASNQVTLRRSGTIGQGPTLLRLSEPAQLFTVRRGGRDVALATGTGQNEDVPNGCCLTFWEVTSARRGNVDLHVVAELSSPAQELVIADLDADGTDELVLLEHDPSGSGAVTTRLLTWSGSAYRVTTPGVLNDMIRPTFLDAGESDGFSGDDVLLADYAPDGFVTRVARLTLRDGSLVREDLPVDPSGFYTARSISVPAGPAILVASDAMVSLMRWQRDTTPEQGYQPNSFIVPLAVLGSGSETLVLAGSAFAGEVSALHVFHAATGEWQLFGSDLRAGLLASGAFLTIPAPSWTHVGPIPGGLPGAAEAFAFSGMSFVPTPGGPDQARVDPIALMPGRSIVGTAGPERAWTALSGTQRFIEQSPRVVTVGASGEPTTLDIAATASILEPEPEQGTLRPTMLGVAPDPERPSQLIVGREAAEFEIEAPPGSQVWWSGSGDSEAVTVGADGVARIRLLDPASDDAEDGERTTRRVWLVTPVGHTYIGSWVIRLYRQPPDLTVDQAPFLDLEPVIAGQTLPGSTMTINGEAVRVAAGGTFSVPISVGIVPTEVRIVVTDPVGNRTEHVTTRIWPLDYRQLPWIPIAVLVTALLGIILFTRGAGGTAPRRRTGPDEDSHIEEIGG